jgi:hypothetical protein
MKKLILFSTLLLVLLSSCIELIDDLTIHNDGSGTFKYILNLSASKIKVNSILALDSIDGKKVPSLNEISEKLNNFALHLKTQPGITNVSMIIKEDDLIVKFSCDFASINDLHNALRAAILYINSGKEIKELNQNWLSWDGKILKRNIPLLSLTISEELKETELDLLKTGSYTSINHFDRPIDHAEKPETKLNPSKTASMLKVNTFDLQNNYSLIENTIYLTPIKNK